MLPNFKNFVKFSTQVMKQCELRSNYCNERLLEALRCDFCLNNQIKNFHTGIGFSLRKKFSPEEEIKRAARSDAKKEGKTVTSFEGDLSAKRREGYFPTYELPNTAFDGILYKELPIVRVLATNNNTHLTLVDQGVVKLIRTCGMEGFKHTRKGTNMAAQALGTSFGLRAIKRGYKSVKVLVDGLGPGRLSSIKGLQLSGVKVVSISDCTPDASELRPRKQKRL